MAEADIRRKVRNRLFALANTPEGDSGTSSDSKDNYYSDQINDVFVIIEEARQNSSAAADCAFQDGYMAIYGKKLAVFIKKAIRKLLKIFLGWYIFPIYSRQSSYNENANKAIECLISANKKQLEIIDELEKRNQVLKNDVDWLKSCLGFNYEQSLIDSDIIDYFDFEDTFRGPREMIMERQKQYLPYLKSELYTDGYVLELGFGRGELLEMMRDNGIAAKGVDVYPPFVEYCADMGFDVCCADALTYLNSCDDESLNGIILSQVAEHIRSDYLYQLIRTGYKKLRNWSYFIIETPNPESLSTYLNFYIDGSHSKPVHFATLQYFFKSNGYGDIIRMNDDYSKHPYEERFRTFVVDKTEDPEKKKILSDINEMMFSGRDYTIIAQKKPAE